MLYCSSFQRQRFLLAWVVVLLLGGGARRILNEAQNIASLTQQHEQEKEETKKGRSCALIFSSGVLLKHADGAWIDSHDEVIRINSADTPGYESYVGSKTTMRVVHPGLGDPMTWFAKQNLTDQTGVVMFHYGKEHFEKIKNMTSSSWILYPNYTNAKCGQMFGYSMRRKGDRQCTSGVSFLWFNRETGYCDEITVFGAVHDHCYPYSYTQPVDPTCSTPMQYPWGPHNYTREHLKLIQMHREGIIRLARIEDEIGENNDKNDNPNNNNKVEASRV